MNTKSLTFQNRFRRLIWEETRLPQPEDVNNSLCPILPPPQLGHTEKPFSRVGERRLLACHRNPYNAMLSLFPAILAVLTAIGLFEESLQDTFRNLAVQVSQVAPDEVVLIRDFSKEITRTKTQVSFVVAICGFWGAQC